MVAPSPELLLRIQNSEHFITTGNLNYLPEASAKYPEFYIHPEHLSTLRLTEPWVEPLPPFPLAAGIHTLAPDQYDRVLVLCVDFSDKPAQIPISIIYNRFFGPGDSFRNYYAENSYGKFVPEGAVFGWFRAPHPLSYYANDNYGKERHGELLSDLLNVITSSPAPTPDDLNWIDNNEDGLVNVMLVHAGGEAAATGNPMDLWAYAFGIREINVKGKTFSTAQLSAEYISNPGAQQFCGVDVHEYGHYFRLPDLYDYSRATAGVGPWSVMGGGSWGRFGGDKPYHFDAWCKMRLGWCIPKQDVAGTVTLRAIEEYPDSILITTPHRPKEYFMAENRQHIGFDSWLEGTGLLIWRINENVDQYSNPDCHLVSLLQADGKRELERGIGGNYSDDPYPGTSNNRAWNMGTNPNTELCDGFLVDAAVENIPDSSESMAFTVRVPVCLPIWECELPLNGYELDGCGDRRLNAECNPCVPVWVCEHPLSGYEIDGCGNLRQNREACSPVPAKPGISPVWLLVPAIVFCSVGVAMSRKH